MYTSMMSRKMILPILAGLLVPWVVNMYHFLGFSTQLVYNDENCVLANPTGLIGSEDLAIGRPRGSSRGNEDGKEDTILFITQGDLKNVFHNNGQAAEGHIWTMRVDAMEPQIAPVVGFPETTLFQPHGCYVSNTNDLLYVINHVGTYSAVEVFSIHYHRRRSRTDDRNHQPPATLTYVHSIRDDDQFPVHGINDVVEGASRGEIYVTIWLPFGIFVSADITMFLQSVLAFVFRVRLTRVLRCTWGVSSSSQCQDATGHRQHRFFMANGITTNDDRSRIFVNDVLDKKIVVFSRSSEGSGSLVFESDIVLPFAGDNVEYDSETGALHIGSIPLLHSPKEGGMMVAITKEEEEEELSIILSPPQWSVTHQVVHDGQKLQQISSAILFGDRVIMGSPNSHGILICGN